MLNYELIKQMSKDMKVSVKELIALAPANDPFYSGQPGQLEKAHWFADTFDRLAMPGTPHLRRIHYAVVSQKTPILKPDGEPYLNTQEDWEYLQYSSKIARYQNLVDSGRFTDNKSPKPTIVTRWEESNPTIDIYGNLSYHSTSFPAFPDLPSYSASGFSSQQRYHLEIWSEKSTMNDILDSFSYHYGANIVTFEGESTSIALHSLIKRLNPKKPARIFYLSDFDPAGQSMPVSASRKAEFYRDKLNYAGDIKFIPVALNREQIERYDLPRIPLKESETRAAKFEQRHGQGGCELDALEAVAPGTLRTLLRHELEQYYDRSLARRENEAREYISEKLEEIQSEIYDRYADQIENLKDEHQQLEHRFENDFSAYSDRLERLWTAILNELMAAQPDVSGFSMPEAKEAQEKPDALYDSSRDYLDQIAYYKRFQGKAAA